MRTLTLTLILPLLAGCAGFDTSPLTAEEQAKMNCVINANCTASAPAPTPPATVRCQSVTLEGHTQTICQ